MNCLLKWNYTGNLGLPGASAVKNPACQGKRAQVRSPAWKDPLEKVMAPHSSILAGEPHGQRSLVGYSPWGGKEWTRLSDFTATMLVAIFLCLFFTPVFNFIWVGFCLMNGSPWGSESNANPLVWQHRPALITAVGSPRGSRRSLAGSPHPCAVGSASNACAWAVLPFLTPGCLCLLCLPSASARSSAWLNPTNLPKLSSDTERDISHWTVA